MAAVIAFLMLMFVSIDLFGPTWTTVLLLSSVFVVAIWDYLLHKEVQKDRTFNETRRSYAQPTDQESTWEGTLVATFAIGLLFAILIGVVL